MNLWAWIILIAAALAVFPMAVRAVMSAALQRFDPQWLLGNVASPDQLALRRHIVTTFLHGMAMSLRVGWADSSLDKVIENTSTYEKAFLVEGCCAGLAMAYSLTPWRSVSSLDRFRGKYEQFEFLNVIGLGFGAGLARLLHLRFVSPDAFVSKNLRTLWADGFGFQHTIFLYRKGKGVPAIIRAADALPYEGYFEGVGRALWFLLHSAEFLPTLIEDFPASVVSELVTGYGIAAGFAGCRQLARSFAEASQFPLTLAAHYKVGMLVGLFARSYVDSAAFNSLLHEQGYETILPLITTAANFYHAGLSRGEEYSIWRSSLLEIVASPLLGHNIQTAWPPQPTLVEG